MNDELIIEKMKNNRIWGFYKQTSNHSNQVRASTSIKIV